MSDDPPLSEYSLFESQLQAAGYTAPHVCGNMSWIQCVAGTSNKVVLKGVNEIETLSSNSVSQTRCYSLIHLFQINCFTSEVALKQVK